ncbi:hypothetical protein [Comamonas odontotermitis]|uniref:hypothetical protein n=1 Tax=Comamonas odontotermitis TaxID=379895 RepID=UPI00374FFCB6
MKERAHRYRRIKSFAVVSLLAGLAATVLVWAWRAWMAPELLMRLLAGFSLCN